MGESRTELLQWLNDLLQLNYTKIEQCGTGAAYCQIFDSIYGMHPHHYYFLFPTFQISKSSLWLINVPLHLPYVLTRLQIYNHGLSINAPSSTSTRFLNPFRRYGLFRRCTSKSCQVHGATRI